MACKLKLQPNPTFELLVSVPVAGKLENEDVVFKVKTVPESKLNDIVGEGVLYADFAKEIVVGWDIDAEFNEQNLMILFDNYPQAAFSLFDAYGKEYYKVAEKK